eukprot:scaffold75984_cov19-Tisochrysis_lutea.AAC.1
MAAYDIVAGSSLPDLRLLAAVDQTSVLEVSFSPNNFDLAQVTVPWAQLPSNPGQLSFQAEGHGEVWFVTRSKDLVTALVQATSCITFASSLPFACHRPPSPPPSTLCLPPSCATLPTAAS